MKKNILIILLFINLTSMAQHTIQGEYYFRKMEMASGFNFSKDGKFQFFFTYGAVDRSASGTFSVEGDMVKLKADKEAGKDFSITKQSKEGKGYALTFTAPNKYLVKNILCLFISDGKQQEVQTDANGQIHVDLDHCDTIYVQHLLFPDVATLIKDKSNNNDHFTLSLNPSLEQVSFKGIDLKIADDKTLSCLPNYFLDMDNIRFVKQ